MLKSYGGRYGVWIGAGRQSERTKPITRTWLKTVLPPYIEGFGLSFSVGTASLRLGVYKAIAAYVSNDYDDVDVEGELSVLGWGLVEEQPEVIGSWVSSEPSEAKSEPSGQSTELSAPPSAAPETEPTGSTTPPSTSGPSPSP